LLDTASKFVLFSVSGLKDEKLIKNQTHMESFKYFCQISSKLILTILSYTVSKLVHVFETQCTYYNFAWVHNTFGGSDPS